MGKWSRFRIDTDNGFIQALIDANNRGELQPMVLPTTPTMPSYQPVNFTPGGKYTLQSEGGAKSVLRSAPVVAGGNNVGNNLEDKAVVMLYEVSRVGIDYWYKVETADMRQGWLSGRGGNLTFTPVPVDIPTPDPLPPLPAETLYAYTLSITLRSPTIEAARLTAIENGIKAIISGISWLGQGVGNSEIEVKVNKVTPPVKQVSAQTIVSSAASAVVEAEKITSGQKMPEPA